MYEGFFSFVRCSYLFTLYSVTVQRVAVADCLVRSGFLASLMKASTDRPLSFGYLDDLRLTFLAFLALFCLNFESSHFWDILDFPKM